MLAAGLSPQMQSSILQSFGLLCACPHRWIPVLGFASLTVQAIFRRKDRNKPQDFTYAQMQGRLHTTKA